MKRINQIINNEQYCLYLLKNKALEEYANSAAMILIIC